MRTNKIYGSSADNSHIGDVIRFIDNHSGFSRVEKDVLANRLALKPTAEELTIAQNQES